MEPLLPLKSLNRPLQPLRPTNRSAQACSTTSPLDRSLPQSPFPSCPPPTPRPTSSETLQFSPLLPFNLRRPSSPLLLARNALLEALGSPSSSRRTKKSLLLHLSHPSLLLWLALLSSTANLATS